MVAMEVAALNATEDPRDGRARQKDRKAASQTVRMGERNRWSTLWKKCGMPPSRAKANIIRELEVIEKSPQLKGVSFPLALGVCGLWGKYDDLLPDTNQNQTHQDHRPISAENIDENLQHWLSDRVIRQPKRAIEILNAKQKTNQHEESKQRTESH